MKFVIYQFSYSKYMETKLSIKTGMSEGQGPGGGFQDADEIPAGGKLLTSCYDSTQCIQDIFRHSAGDCRDCTRRGESHPPLVCGS